MSEEKLTRIENLKRRMYSRGTKDIRGIPEHNLQPSQDFTKTDWERSMSLKKKPLAQKPTLRFFLIFSVAFFVAALGYATYLYFGGANTVSNKNITISINGPVSIRGGEKLSLEISVENNNSTMLEVADLIVEYPEGTRDADNLSLELPRFREGLGDIAPGGVVKKNVRAVLFGEERSVKNIKAIVEYRVPGSNAIFYKESEYQVVISSAPLSILVQSPKETTSGQELVLKVTVNSNSKDVIKDVILKAEYPAGFSFQSSDPKPLAGNSVWSIGDIKPESKRVFTIKGILSGENLDARVFRFTSGVASSKDPTVIATPFVNLEEEISIKKPFVGLSLVVNGSNEENVSVSSGKPVRLDIKYTNNLLVPVSDVEISLEIKGSALDKTSVSAQKGFYRSVDDVVIWNKSTYQDLSFIPPGESGTMSVTLASLSLSKGIASIRNPEINISAGVKGRRVESGVPQEVSDSLRRSIKIQSDVGLNGRLLYYSGPFKNTGPIPPKAEKETSYSVVLTVTNGSNDLSDTLVSASLPSYTRFVKSESGESLSFNEVGGLVTWNMGSVKAGTGFGTPPREAVFQIVFTPSVSQIGETPLLVSDISLSATDRFTGGVISVVKNGLNINLVSDAGAKQGNGVVVK